MTKSDQKDVFAPLDEVEPEELEWLMPPLIPKGMVTVMEGDPNVGKSYLAMHLAAQISIGGALPGVPRLKAGDVLYMSAEDDAAFTIRPRVEAMGGDPGRIRYQASYSALDDEGLQILWYEVKRTPPRLIVIDPLFAYVPGSADIYRPNVIRPLLSELGEIARYSDAAVIAIRHLTKAKRDKAIYQGAGSMDVIAAARSAVLVANHPNDPDTKVVAHVKHNLSPRGTSLTYRLILRPGHKMPVLEWTGTTDLQAEDLFRGDDVDRHSAREDALDFLREQLKKGPKEASAVISAAEPHSISKRTLDRAKKEIGVVADKKGKAWMWSLPEKG